MESVDFFTAGFVVKEKTHKTQHIYFFIMNTRINAYSSGILKTHA